MCNNVYMKYNFDINNYKMLPTQRVKKQNTNLLEISNKFFLTEDKTNAFIEVDYFINLVGEEDLINSKKINPLRNFNRKLELTQSKQNKFLQKHGFTPIIGSLEENQRLMVMSNFYVYHFKVNNKNKLRSFISKNIKK